MTPDQWIRHSNGQIEELGGYTPPVVYAIPTSLTEENFTLLLQANEFCRTHRAANVIANPVGGRMTLHTMHRTIAEGDQHRVSVFRAQSLTILAWVQSESSPAKLEIRREAIALEGGRPVRRSEQILPPWELPINDPFRALPEKLDGCWRPALKALIKLRLCRNKCNKSHYSR